MWCRSQLGDRGEVGGLNAKCVRGASDSFDRLDLEDFDGAEVGMAPSAEPTLVCQSKRDLDQATDHETSKRRTVEGIERQRKSQGGEVS